MEVLRWFVARACRYDREGLTRAAAGYAIRWEGRRLLAGCESYRRELESAHERTIHLDELLGPRRARVALLRANLLPALDCEAELEPKHAKAMRAWRQRRCVKWREDDAPIAYVARAVTAEYPRPDREALNKRVSRLLALARGHLGRQDVTVNVTLAGPETRSAP